MADYLGALTLLPARRPCFSQMLGPSRLLPVDRVRNVDGPFLLGGNTSSLLLCRHLDWAFTVCCQAALASRSQLRFSLRLGVCLFSLSADRPLPKRLWYLSLPSPSLHPHLSIPITPSPSLSRPHSITPSSTLHRTIRPSFLLPIIHVRYVYGCARGGGRRGGEVSCLLLEGLCLLGH